MSPTHSPEQGSRINIDELLARITVGDRTQVAEPAHIEFVVRFIETAITSDQGFGWVIMGRGLPGERTVRVLVTPATPVVVDWPVGYEPFTEPNEMVDDLLANPADFGIH